MEEVEPTALGRTKHLGNCYVILEIQAYKHLQALTPCQILIAVFRIDRFPNDKSSLEMQPKHRYDA